MAFGVIFARPGAVGLIIGQNFGAGQDDRVRGAWRRGLIFTALYVLTASALLFAFRAPLSDLFQATGEARALV